ncbi:MAG: hypothetical protein JXA04_00390 [Gammaproteobacteria bacterium]|nr:hypothetical protein [Gammaproteobacteria bacterium]
MMKQTAANETSFNPKRQGGVVLKLEDIRKGFVESVPEAAEKESQYWILKLWLYGVIAFNAANILNTVINKYFYQVEIQAAIAGILQLTDILIFIGAARILFSIALLKFRKWGFWGMAIIELFALVLQINLGFATVLNVMWALFGLSMLYGLLHPGGKNDAWFKLI